MCRNFFFRLLSQSLIIQVSRCVRAPVPRLNIFHDGFKVLNPNKNTNDQLCRVIAEFDDDRDLENTLLSYCKNTPQYRDLCCGKKLSEMTLEDITGIRIYLPFETVRFLPQLEPYVCGRECKTWSNIPDYEHQDISAKYRYSNYYSLYRVNDSNQYRFLSLVCF